MRVRGAAPKKNIKAYYLGLYHGGYLPDKSHRILLFGSWTTLEAAPTSDIDIAIAGATAVDPTVMSEIHEEIERLSTLRKIQIIDVQHVHDRFRDRVLSQGQVLT